VVAGSADNIPAMRTKRIQLIAIACGGALGAVVRIAVYEAAPIGAGFPWQTLVINVAGAALLGVTAAMTVSDDPVTGWRLPLIGTGFSGALTTFSGLCIETLDLLEAGLASTALAYVALSIALGLPAAAIGGRLANGPRSGRMASGG